MTPTASPSTSTAEQTTAPFGATCWSTSARNATAAFGTTTHQTPFILMVEIHPPLSETWFETPVTHMLFWLSQDSQPPITSQSATTWPTPTERPGLRLELGIATRMAQAFTI